MTGRMASLQILWMVPESVTAINRHVWLLQADGAQRAALQRERMVSLEMDREEKARTDRRRAKISSRIVAFREDLFGSCAFMGATWGF